MSTQGRDGEQSGAASPVLLIVATRNRHKVSEIDQILGPPYTCRSLAELTGAPEIIEDGRTFSENATKKAVTLARWLAARGSDLGAGEQFVLADDSGLEVDALGGAPGVHSARFAALDHAAVGHGNSPDESNNEKLLRLLKDVPEEKRTARFRCVLALTPVGLVRAMNRSPVCAADEWELQTEIFEGACEGRIAFAPRGGGGFGYDPLFVPSGHELSFAELGEEIKNAMSHRFQALQSLRRQLERKR